MPGAGRPDREAGSRHVGAGSPARRRRVRRTSLLLAPLLALSLVAGCGGTEIKPPRPPGDDTDARAAAAGQLLERLRTDLAGHDGADHDGAEHDRAAVSALAAPDPASRSAVRAIFANAEALGLRDVDFRYVDEDSGEVDPDTAKTYGDRAWSATVSATWRIPGYDNAETHQQVRFTFVATAGGAVRIASAGGGDERGALWLDGSARVAKGPDTLVITAGADPGRFSAMARRAVRTVRAVLPRWHGALVIEVPASEDQLEQLLHADKGEYTAIAAVTTSVDGSLVRGSPVHVFVNPAVFDDLGPRGAQVVLSHEATHVATGATFTSMPTWLLEGFADYVALLHAGIPLRTAAGQILARVHRDGPPGHLPTSAELDPSAKGLGATYELAWTACRFLGATYGESTMVAFYDAVAAGASTEQAFARVVGVSQAGFVRGWSADLARLARGMR